MKKSACFLLRGGLIIAFCFLQSCIQEDVIPEDQTTIITSLVGDKDGFGIGLVDRDVWSPATSGINSWPISYQDNDPEFTDIYPADKSGVINYQHNYEAIGSELISAKFVFITLGIQDGDSQVYGSDTDILFFIDGEEVAAAFDNVDQFDNYDGKWMGSVGTIELIVPQHLLPYLQDGEVVIAWEILQLSTCGCHDSFAIDYSELIMVY